ncbi:MAG: hypothetical protein LUD72_13045 [Bacteroidales bacterium]|nr:hypothetical protein [Bacteroidales bacterium]
MKRRRFMPLWMALLVLVVALTCGVLFACSGGEDKTKDEFDPNAIVGVWSNSEIVAQTDFMTVTEATAAVELDVRDDGTLSLHIKDIYVEFQGVPLDLSVIEMNMEGTWRVEADDYVLGLDDNSNVTYDEGGQLKIVPVRENGEITAVSISFSLSYHIDVFGGYEIPISMTDARLYAGALG